MSSSAPYQLPDEATFSTRDGQVADSDRRPSGDTAGSLLEHLPQAALLVDGKGVVGSLNERASIMVAHGDGLLIRHGILRCMHPKDTSVMHQMIADAAQRERSPERTRGRGLRIQRPVGRLPLTALVTALVRPDASGGGPVIAVFVSDPERVLALDLHLLRVWYGLTPAEARVAALLTDGLTVAEIVDRLRIGANTARTHLKSIFAKTSTRRQAELIRLLLSNPTPGMLANSVLPAVLS